MLGRLCGAAGRRGYTSVGGVRSLEAGLITASHSKGDCQDSINENIESAGTVSGPK